MAERLADAHLFIGRAGASTIAELTAVGRPAILVPLPIATDDHQAANTREIARRAARAIDPAGPVHRPNSPSRSRPSRSIPKRWPTPRMPHGTAAIPMPRATWPTWSKSFGGAPLMDVIRVAGRRGGLRAQHEAGAGGGARA
jgi:UDP-N-acetylglucosamine--N-acetylmuramyl-(pentapeptide) pyrophosphoryl-undecaprenol N-acetylglucosamine transferase